MYTKIQAAKIAVNAGIALVIASGTQDGVVREILTGQDVGTLFPSKHNRLQVRKSWLAFGSRIAGDVQVDSGCAKAIAKTGTSLLAAGIVKVQGEFEQGKTIRILDPNGRELARGLSNYSSSEIERIRGKHTDEISSVLGYKTTDEVVHRDHLVLMV